MPCHQSGNAEQVQERRHRTERNPDGTQKLEGACLPERTDSLGSDKEGKRGI